MGGRGQGELLWCRSLPGPTSSHVQPMSTVEPAACKERLSVLPRIKEKGAKQERGKVESHRRVLFAIKELESKAF